MEWQWEEAERVMSRKGGEEADRVGRERCMHTEAITGGVREGTQRWLYK